MAITSFVVRCTGLMLTLAGKLVNNIMCTVYVCNIGVFVCNIGLHVCNIGVYYIYTYIIYIYAYITFIYAYIAYKYNIGKISYIFVCSVK